jgi:hypothetical protein
VEEGHYWWWHPGRASEVGSREKAILGETGRRCEDIVLGNTGHRWGKAWLVGEETPSIGEVVQ